MKSAFWARGHHHGPYFFALLFTLLVPLTSVAEAWTTGCSGTTPTTEQLRAVAKSDTWLRLLHFRRNQTRFSSQADGKLFFLSEQGARDPLAELQSTLQALCSRQTREYPEKHLGKQPLACQVPARKRYLSQALPGLVFPDDSCVPLEQWRQRLRMNSIRLVFSSYYANNPSSVFGHTLLRVDPKPTPESPIVTPLLSTGINFAAEVGAMSPVIYALYGMAGVFPGRFTALPYYYKVREYSDFDSRDLWEYELLLTDAEKEQLTDHLWELGFTHFNYYYFTENCSYQLLTALEAAVPRLQASTRVPWWVIPADSVKAIVREPGLLGRIEFRPSLFRQYQTRRDLLSREEQSVLNALVRTREVAGLKSLSPERRAYVLDTALDYWDYKFTRELLEKNADKVQFKQELLKLRAVEPRTPHVAPDPSQLTRPDQSHESMRYGVYADGFGSEGTRYGLELRYAMHDFLDPQEGYPETAKIEFFSGRFDLAAHGLREGESALRVSSLKFFDVQLLSPMTQDNSGFSWRGTVGADRRFGLGCDDCLAARAAFQGGYTLGFLRDSILVYGLGGAEARAAGEHSPYWLLPVASAIAGTRLRFTSRLLSLLEYTYDIPVGTSRDPVSRASGELRYSPTLQYSMGLSVIHDAAIHETRGLVQLYLFR